jgi:hypothetical protein
VRRRILANLFGEDELAGRRTTPSRAALETAARMGSLLRVFGREGDELILEPVLLRCIDPGGEVLAWCETATATALRGGPRPPSAISWDAPLSELVWQLPTPSPAVVAAVHHRAFHLQVAREIGCALPGARMVDSFADLGDLPPSWVLKAPLSASGRNRYIEKDGPGLSDPKTRRTVERLFEVNGPLLLEPWMDRVADFGVAALLTHEDLRIAGIHGQRVDLKGQFAGIDLEPDLTEADRGILRRTTEAVAAALRAAGYVGPFGLDAWKYRDGNGSVFLNPLGEINARMTFGLVAWASCSNRC